MARLRTLVPVLAASVAAVAALAAVVLVAAGGGGSQAALAALVALAIGGAAHLVLTTSSATGRPASWPSVLGAGRDHEAACGAPRRPQPPLSSSLRLRR